jgi:hypothetical protein
MLPCASKQPLQQQQAQVKLSTVFFSHTSFFRRRAQAKRFRFQSICYSPSPFSIKIKFNRIQPRSLPFSRQQPEPTDPTGEPNPLTINCIV